MTYCQTTRAMRPKRSHYWEPSGSCSSCISCASYSISPLKRSRTCGRRSRTADLLWILSQIARSRRLNWLIGRYIFASSCSLQRSSPTFSLLYIYRHRSCSSLVYLIKEREWKSTVTWKLYLSTSCWSFTSQYLASCHSFWSLASSASEPSERDLI